MTRTPDEMRADAERAQALIVEELPKPDFVAAARTAVPALASDVLSLLAAIDGLFPAIAHGDEKHRQWLKNKLTAHFGRLSHDSTYAHGVSAGLISAAEYLGHEATLTEANRDRATDEEHRRAYTVQAGIYRSAALVCRSRANVAAPEAEAVERRTGDEALERAAQWHESEAAKEDEWGPQTQHKLAERMSAFEAQFHRNSAKALRAMKGGGT